MEFLVWCGMCDEMWLCGALPPRGCVMWNVAVRCGTVMQNVVAECGNVIHELW